MKKLYIALVGTCLLLCCFQTVMAQVGKYEKANKAYGQLAYLDASDIYRHVAEKGFRSAELLQKLGNSLYFNADYAQAAVWYGELFSHFGKTEGLEQNPIYCLRYAQSLYASGDEKKAKQWFDRYKGLLPPESQGTVTANGLPVDGNPQRYTVENLEVNTSGLDFGASFMGDRLLFASTRDTGTVATHINSWDNRTFLNLYGAAILDNGGLGEVTRLKKVLRSRFHESSPAVTREGDTLYFTRTNVTPKSKKEKKGAKTLKIYRVVRQNNGKWGKPEDLSINGSTFNTAHPALGPKGDRLYFVSDRDGSLGQTDIYVTDILKDGSLGVPQNLGPQINTQGRESFPFVTARNELYFASDGHFGLGGYDVFYTALSGPTARMPINLGAPINSGMDDFAFALDTDKKKGYFSSNRPGGKGNDDIYAFVEHQDIASALMGSLRGTVRDADTGEPLEQVSMTLFNGKGERVGGSKTDAQGNYLFPRVNIGIPYRILSEKEDYDSDDAQFLWAQGADGVDFALKRNSYALVAGADLAKMLNIPLIYFDFGSSQIRPDAAIALQKTLAALERHPGLKIHIRSHTDSQGDDAYNMALSRERARSTLEWLVKNGIARDRLMATGHGESEPVAPCGPGQPCDAAEHQRNRRSELIVME